MSLYSFTDKDITTTVNIAKEVTLAGMAREGFLTGEQYNILIKDYVIVVVKKGWFGKLFDKVRGIDSDPNSISYMLVKVA